MTLQERALKLRRLLKNLSETNPVKVKEIVRIVKEIVELDPVRIINQLVLMLNAFIQVCMEVDNAEELLDVCDTVYDYDEEDLEEVEV